MPSRLRAIRIVAGQRGISVGRISRYCYDFCVVNASVIALATYAGGSFTTYHAAHTIAVVTPDISAVDRRRRLALADLPARGDI